MVSEVVSLRGQRPALGAEKVSFFTTFPKRAAQLRLAALAAAPRSVDQTMIAAATPLSGPRQQRQSPSDVQDHECDER